MPTVTEKSQPLPLSRAAPIPPGSTIGIVGGGQLGRMAIIAAAQLGYRSHVFCPEENCPAGQISTEHTLADYDDEDALRTFAESVDVITIEFENIPYDSVRLLSELSTVRPNKDCLRLAQNRLREKTFLNDTGAPTAKFFKVTSPDQLAERLKQIGTPAVLKTAEWGYDGKGQVKINSTADVEAAWAEMGGEIGIVEEFIDFEMELSIILARGPDGAWTAFEPVENRHKDHILDLTLSPANVSVDVANSAIKVSQHIAAELDLIGLLAVEFFLTKDGRLLVNEIAPRPHNSGHWSIDAASPNQFGLFVRAVCGLPLGPVERHHDAIMKNLIGDDVESWQELMSDPKAHVHLYGKRQARPRRKMGHVNYVYPKGSRPDSL